MDVEDCWTCYKEEVIVVVTAIIIACLLWALQTLQLLPHHLTGSRPQSWVSLVLYVDTSVIHS